MKQRTLKKMLNTIFVLVFALTAVLTVTLPNVAMAASDFLLTQACDNEPLRTGELFKITISMTNITGSGGDINGIELDFSAASDIAVLTSGGTVVTSASVVKQDGVPVVLGEYNMRFVGDGSAGLIPVKVTYKLNGVAKGPVTSNLYLEVETPTTPGPTPDPDLYKPNLVATIPDDTTITAGEYTGIKFTIKNISTTTSASNVTLTPVTDTTFTQAKILTTMPINQLYTNGTAEVTLSILADKYKAAGTYPFKFKLTSRNAFGVEYTNDYTVNINIENNNKDTKLTVQTSSADNISAAAGKSFTIPVYIVNSGTFYAKDVTVTLTDLSQDTFTLQSGAGKFLFDRVNGNYNQKFDVKLNASNSLKTGSYPISFKLEYTTEAGEKIADTQQIWLPVTGSGDSVSSLEVTEVKTSATTVKVADSFDVTVKVKNSGTVEANQVKVSADGTAALLPVTQNMFIISKLAPGETRSMNFKFQPSPDAKKGSVPIVIKVESVSGGESSTISQAVSVFIDAEENAADPSKDVPKIIVGNYSYEPQQVKAGENFTLKMQFVNTHSTKTIKNIKGNFTVNETSVNQTGNVFTPVGASNTFYIDEISPKGTSDWSLVLYTIPDAQSKTYTVTISFDYEDEQGNPFKENEIIGIPVYQPTRLEVSDISVPTDGFMGQPVYIPFTMYNMGKTTIYNVRMSVEGDFDAQPKSQYFGNYDPGYQEYVELNLIPMNVGTGNGKVIIQYENSTGEVQTVEKEFSMNVQDMAAMNPGGEMPVDGGKFPGDQGGMVIGPDGKPINGDPGAAKAGGFIGSPLFFIIIGVVVVAGVVITILVVRKRKKEKEFDF